MRTISESLLAAQRSAVRVPYVRCVVDDQPIEMPRFSWSQVYNGTEGEYPHDAALAADGSIVRTRVAYNGVTGKYDFYVQRVTDPPNASQWASWNLLQQDVAALAAAVKADDASAMVVVFYVAGDGRSLVARRSTNYGATFGGEEIVWSVPSGLIRAVGADGAYSDQNVVFVYDPQGTDPDDYLLVSEYSGGAWGAPWVDVERRYSAVSEVSVARGADGVLTIVVSSGWNGPIGVRTFVVESGFSGSYDLLTPGSGSGYSCCAGSVLWVPSVGRWFYIYYEGIAGLQGRMWLACTADRGWLGEAIPLAMAATQYGMRLLRRGSDWYLVAVNRAYRSAGYAGGAGETMDVTASVRRFEMRERAADGSPGILVLELENSDGRYLGAGQSDAAKALRPGSRVAVGLGYVTSAGSESMWVQPWVVDRVELVRDGSTAALRLVCVDMWEILERVVAARQVTLQNVALQGVLRRGLWPICDIGIAALHSNLATMAPLFVWQPGESYAAIVRRVLRMAGLGLRFKTDAGAGYGWGSIGVDVYEYGAGTSAYSYAPGEHDVVSASIGRGAARVNGAFVTGSLDGLGNPYLGVAYDYEHIGLAGKLFLGRIFEKHLDSAAKCAARAGYALKEAKAGAAVGVIKAWVNVGLEVGDVVDVTDSALGLSEALYRVAGLKTAYDALRGQYVQDIELAGV